MYALTKGRQAGHRLALGHNQYIPIHASTAQNTDNPCLITIIQWHPIFCSNVPQIQHNNHAMFTFNTWHVYISTNYNYKH